MPIPSTRITALTDAGNEDPKDKFQLQRQVLGTWQDFYTTPEVYYGGLITRVFEWDVQAGLTESIVSGGNHLMVINAMAVMAPNPTPSTSTVQVYLSQGALIQWGLIEPEDTLVGSGALLGYQYDPATTPYTDTMVDLDIISSAQPFSNTCRLIVQYVLQAPI